VHRLNEIEELYPIDFDKQRVTIGLLRMLTGSETPFTGPGFEAE